MLFNTLSYAIFLPIVFLLYWFMPRVRWQNVALLVASYAFYAIGDWRFLGLLIGMSLLSWFTGRIIDKKYIDARQATINLPLILLWCTISIDIFVLGFFKYYNFFAESFANLFGTNPNSVTLRLVLPLGISFFTFQSISYVVDVYRKKINSTNIVDCLLYIAFFPKLLAGPIERPTNLLPQIQHKRVFEYDTAVDGCRQILWGLFKKVVVADGCAMVVDKAWDGLSGQLGSMLLLIAILYTIQIYGDFSGYSDMAIGSAKLLGFRFRDNFLFPYFSRNMGEFWKRWHISLNTWFVDYVYIPLGGSRNGKARTIANTMIIFLLSGLWHGADWSFVAWGGYHGLLLVLLILLGWNTRYEEVVSVKCWYPNLREMGQMLLVFVFTTIGWILFRANDIGQFVEFISCMCSKSLLYKPNISGINGLILMIGLMFVVEWVMRRRRHGLDLSGVQSGALRWVIYLGILFVTFAFGGHSENFIYMYF